MCGILGFFGKTPISEKNLCKLINTKNILKERGPDDYGFIKENNYFLSNSRLRIIDKKQYNLPITKHNSIISFSGEILNYRKLKSFLKNEGYFFFTDTDTELILSLYHFYGESFLDHLEGFFFNSNFDKNKKKLFSTPFLYEQFKNRFYFDIMQNLNKNAKICTYFSIHGIKKMLQDHKKNDHSNFLMRMLTLHLFFESKY